MGEALANCCFFPIEATAGREWTLAYAPCEVAQYQLHKSC